MSSSPSPRPARETRLYRGVFAVGIALVLLVTVCRTAMFGVAYDYEMRFFERGPAEGLLAALTALALLFCLAGLLLFRGKGKGEPYPAPSSTGTLFAALAGFFLLATVIMQAIYAVSGLDVGRYSVEDSWFWHLFTGNRLQSDAGQTLQFLALAVAVPAAAYFLYTSFAEKPKATPRAVLGIFFLLWCALEMLVLNFDMSIPMNSPERLGPLVAFLSAMLFAAAELRWIVGRGRLSLLFTAGMMTLLFCFSDAVPTLLFSFAGRFPMGISTIYTCVEIAISLYALMRLAAFCRSPAEVSATEANAATEAAASAEADTSAETAAAAGEETTVAEETPATGSADSSDSAGAAAQGAAEQITPEQSATEQSMPEQNVSAPTNEQNAAPQDGSGGAE